MDRRAIRTRRGVRQDTLSDDGIGTREGRRPLANHRLSNRGFGHEGEFAATAALETTSLLLTSRAPSEHNTRGTRRQDLEQRGHEEVTRASPRLSIPLLAPSTLCCKRAARLPPTSRRCHQRDPQHRRPWFVREDPDGVASRGTMRYPLGGFSGRFQLGREPRVPGRTTNASTARSRSITRLATSESRRL